jgi:glycerophosphoryl diester phosphodiesterase
MVPGPGFEVQGHRGALGVRPENTLAGFELALDLGVTSIETDVHLTRDRVPVLHHDPIVLEPLHDRPRSRAIHDLTAKQLRTAQIDCRLETQTREAGPLTRAFAQDRGFDPFGIPTLVDLFAFLAAYTGAPGRIAGKTPKQRRHAARVIVDLELKRSPFGWQIINDGYDGTRPSVLERRVLDDVAAAGMIDRVRVRSFDHRCVRFIRDLEPRLQTAVLIHHTAPVRPGDLVEAAGAAVYCPDHAFVDAEVVRQVHAAGKRIIPWTVNEPAEWRVLVEWGVDGITTDFPEQLVNWLRRRRIAVAGHEP